MSCSKVLSGGNFAAAYLMPSNGMFPFIPLIRPVMMNEIDKRLTAALARYRASGIETQVDFERFYLYSLITHSTAIEGSTMTEVENQLLFDEGISPAGHTLVEQLMNVLQRHFGLPLGRIMKEQKASYITALADAREEDDEQIFIDRMLLMLAENMEADVRQYEADTAL